MSASRRLSTLPAGASLWRAYLVGQEPLWFGPRPGKPPRHRFDAPDGSYRVCYLAHRPEGAFVETYLRDPDVEGSRIRILAASELRKREMIRVDVVRELRLARLRGPGLSWRGITASVSSTPRYSETQRLSAQIHLDPDEPAGIEYRCRHDDDQLAVAVFDRARDALRADASSVESCLEVGRRLEPLYPFVVDGKS